MNCAEQVNIRIRKRRKNMKQRKQQTTQLAIKRRKKTIIINPSVINISIKYEFSAHKHIINKIHTRCTTIGLRSAPQRAPYMKDLRFEQNNVVHDVTCDLFINVYCELPLRHRAARPCEPLRNYADDIIRISF